MSKGGPTREALASIEERRNDAVNDLVKEGKEALSDSTRQSRGIFRMAVRLLGIRQGVGGTGSAEAIEKQMRQEYWNGRP
jgi:hypothetical protein